MISEEECELDSFALLVLGGKLQSSLFPTVGPKVIVFAVLQSYCSGTLGNF